MKFQASPIHAVVRVVIDKKRMESSEPFEFEADEYQQVEIHQLDSTMTVVSQQVVQKAKPKSQKKDSQKETLPGPTGASGPPGPPPPAPQPSQEPAGSSDPANAPPPESETKPAETK